MKTCHDIICQHIKENGPVSLAYYMIESLFGKYGYYQQVTYGNDRADFLTSPRISQVFGELIGVWIIHVWSLMKSPRSWSIIEIGGGNGIMMQDILSVILAQDMPLPHIHMVDNSKNMLYQQRHTLKNNDKISISYSESIDKIPLDPLRSYIVIGNEFFDCLPIRQFMKYQNSWYERMIGIKENDNKLCFVKGHQIHRNSPEYNMIPKNIREDGDNNSIYEVSLASYTWLHTLDKITKDIENIQCLFIDYGSDEDFTGNTFQGIYKKGIVDPLENPGVYDITAHVNFRSIQNYITKNTRFICDSIITQRHFLYSLGIMKRLEIVLKSTPLEKHDSIKRSISYLIHKNTMGSLFKVLSFRSSAVPQSYIF